MANKAGEEQYIPATEATVHNKYEASGRLEEKRREEL
jgi:hypothetical protein